MAPRDSDPQSLAEPLMLEKIDKLFACGVGELVDLPQIVVVGDQSSGKSSVLEGLIQKPLPRDSGLCTRFATQIVFRREAQQQILVSIIPDHSASKEHIARVKAWGRSVPTLDPETFREIMQEAHREMGLSGDDGETERRPTFSNDVLRLEISGPDQQHLSVIDVPGIFKSTTEGLTTKADIQLVRNMVKGYMDNPRSIMLAVVPANVDLATQEILELARESDPHGDRTLGVLTKPDLVDKGAESGVLDLLTGRARRMKLDWHIIRNPGQKELQDVLIDRGSLEADFFRSVEPWNSIDNEKAGINSLRLRLKEVHSTLVKRVFPRVKVEIRSRLDICQKQLDDLGPERNSPAKQMEYLTKLSVNFQRLVTLALNATHGADNSFAVHARLRIAPAVMSRMKTFSDEMAQYGHTFAFRSQEIKKSEDNETGSDESGSEESDDEESDDNKDDGDGQDQSIIQGSDDTLDCREEEDLAELIEILHTQTRLPFPEREGINEWIQQAFSSNRGFELGIFNASLLATCMKKQCSKWEDISLGFLSDVIVMVHGFIDAALTSVCNDQNIRDALMNRLSDELIRRYQKAVSNTQFLLKVESSDAPMTHNHYFNDNLQKRQGNAKSEIKKHAYADKLGKLVVPFDRATQVTRSMSNDEYVVQEIHNILKSYYKVSRKTFVDNVCRQGALHYLLQCEESPLALFSPIFVSRLSTTELEELAGEEPGLKRSRIQLNKDRKSLVEAMKILASS